MAEFLGIAIQFRQLLNIRLGEFAVAIGIQTLLDGSFLGKTWRVPENLAEERMGVYNLVAHLAFFIQGLKVGDVPSFRIYSDRLVISSGIVILSGSLCAIPG